MIDTNKLLTDIARMLDEEGQSAANQLRVNARRNTGTAANSVRWLTYLDNVKVWGILTHAEHLRYAIDGRMAGKMPPDKPIRDWLQSKGWKGKDGNTLSKDWQKNSAVYAVRKKIGEHGTNHQAIGTYEAIVKNLVDNVQKNIEPNLDIIKQLTDSIQPVKIKENY